MRTRALVLPAARRPAAVVACTYLLATLPFAVAAASTGRGVTASLLHALGVAVLAMVALHHGPMRARVVADWLPLAIIPLLYAELPALIAGAGTMRNDAIVMGWEAALFGDPSRTLAARLHWRWLSELLHLGYFLYYPLIYVPPLLLYVQDRQREFTVTCVAVVATFALCFAVFVAFPVEGPRYTGVAPAPDGPMRSIVLALLERGSSRGAAFPSSHVAVAVAQTAMAWARRSRLTPVYVLVTLGLSAGAVYGGFHYGIDVVAGALVGAAVALAVLAWGRTTFAGPASKGRS